MFSLLFLHNPHELIGLIPCHIRMSHYTDNVSTTKILLRCVIYLATVFITISFAVSIQAIRVD